MKKLKVKALLNKRGEMLIETIISIMLFTVLIIGVTTMITASTNRIRETQREAEAVQDTVNLLVTGDSTISEAPMEIKFTFTDNTATLSDVTVTDAGFVKIQEKLVYFYPQP